MKQGWLSFAGTALGYAFGRYIFLHLERRHRHKGNTAPEVHPIQFTGDLQDLGKLLSPLTAPEARDDTGPEAPKK